jgi:hypothetical protein
MALHLMLQDVAAALEEGWIDLEEGTAHWPPVQSESGREKALPPVTQDDYAGGVKLTANAAVRSASGISVRSALSGLGAENTTIRLAA